MARHLAVVALCLLTAASVSVADEPASAEQQAVEALSRVAEAVTALGTANRQLSTRVEDLEQQLAAQELPRIAILAGRAAHVAIDPTGIDDVHLQEWWWDFGDPHAAESTSSGFNAAHVYEQPGSYVVTLNGRPFTRVEAVQDRRPVHEVTTVAEAAARLRLGERVRLPAGVLEIDAPLVAARGAELLGHEAGSTLLWIGAPTTAAMFDAAAGTVLVKNVSFASRFSDTFGKEPPDGVRAGDGTVIIGCTFEHIETAINGNARPDGVHVRGCRSLLPTGLRGYFAWVQGTQWVIERNVAVNSTREHVVRCSVGGPEDAGARFVTLRNNDFANTEKAGGDVGDMAKSAINFQVVEHAWAEGNLLSGMVEAGPLGEADGLQGAHGRHRRARYVVLRDNLHRGPVRLKHGLEHVLVASSRIDFSAGDQDGSVASLRIEPFHTDYDRGCVDVELRENVITGRYKDAMLLWVQGEVAGGLAISGNTLAVGTEKAKWASLPVVFGRGWFEGITFEGNTLPPAPGGWPDARATVRIGDQNDKAAYLRPDAFDALPGVSGNRFMETNPADLDRLAIQWRGRVGLEVQDPQSEGADQ